MKENNITRRFLIGGLSLATLAGCTGTRFNTVAGASIDEGGFGNPTRQNMLVMTGEAPALAHMGSRFAAQVPTTINFAFNSAALDATARAVLDQQAAFIRSFPEVRFSVYGHTDKVGSNAYNKQLGLARARAAVAYLASRGVSTSRLQALVSYGETRPLVPTQSAERANRRTVTEVAGFVADHPMVLDGKYGQIVYRRYVGSAAGPGVAAAVAAAAAAPAGEGGSAGRPVPGG
ncbi:OmpA family protein [Jannaschia rubra]|uniref:Minor outer membrane protein Omp16 n=1 Tax=Jannaschia rubra TaxID=282197 RepID=A0A0M6XTA5_9RHOB|nr:OmpA family protein [Jannaschia rubra]CTQ33847.1 Minor outer membrane protein Omp16 [Jannaschia rubra]SFG10714.1 Outer membrane protein OmpA [Jannaschia rubra]